MATNVLFEILWKISSKDFFGPILSNQVAVSRGGSRVFSRGAEFSKTFKNHFFRFTKLIYRTLADPILTNFFGHFLKNLDKQIAFFFGARSPSKLVYIGANVAFNQVLGSVGQKWTFKKYQRDPRAGGQKPEEKRPLPLNPPVAAGANLMLRSSSSSSSSCIQVALQMPLQLNRVP